MGHCHIVVGRKKTGKTTLTKELLNDRPKDMPVLIYDIDNEYQDFQDRDFEDWQEFLQLLPDTKNTYVVIEEATIFLDTSDRIEEMKNILVRSRKTGNIIQLNFHGLKFVPTMVYGLAEYITIFKTNDGEIQVRRKFDDDRLLEIFTEVRKSPDEHKNITLNLY